MKHFDLEILVIYGILAHFEFKAHKDFLYKITLNIFEYISWEKCPKKSDKKKIWTMSKFLYIHKDSWTKASVKLSRYSQKILIAKVFQYS